MEPRLSAHLEINALIRRVAAEGGFGSVLQKGEPDAGTILVVLTERGGNARVFERMPDHDGHRKWTLSKLQNPENKREIDEWLDRRGAQDPDLWIVELDIVDGERFIGLTD
ncbi:DUF1491 family protein [Novosphingobium sp. B 225]|uniref:DUF1491 family protein n=1 Tax=Novosphingobium sp. B 225 TaxID=1961849 RepID=UPI000B4B7997|nr:DUF1491 family protein [Novosphingobium sp. B 225]